MLTLLIGLLTAILVLDALLLILLILVQLPKKDAGAGLAFGGGAADALLGAGSGNVLTNLTKYAAGIFFVLCLTLAILGTQAGRPGSIAEELRQTGGDPEPQQEQIPGVTTNAPQLTLPGDPNTPGTPPPQEN
ncbi:MAG TPA: preprotein translocase subunit SecG [Methylomirabilota bacterium]|nr:preprotein translocase subunit SecG [Methylomirabilota bacterium]